jgi:hypothetical protein
MAKMSDYFKGAYFNAKSLEDGDLTLTISYCEARVFDSKEQGKPDEQKMVVWFEEDERGLALNVTNWQAIAEILGDEDTDKWPGHQIMLVRKKDRGMGGKIDWCVRIEDPQRQGQRPQQRQPQPQQRQQPHATERAHLQPQRSAQAQRAATAQASRQADYRARGLQEGDEDPETGDDVPF